MRELLTLLEESVKPLVDLERFAISVHRAVKADRIGAATLLLCPIKDEQRWLIISWLVVSCEPLQGRQSDYEWACIEASLLATSPGFALRAYMDFVNRRANKSRIRRLGRLVFGTIIPWLAVSEKKNVKRLLRHIHLPRYAMSPQQACIARYVFGEMSQPENIPGCSVIDDVFKVKAGTFSAVDMVPPIVALRLLDSKPKLAEAFIQKANNSDMMDRQARVNYLALRSQFFQYMRASELICIFQKFKELKPYILGHWHDRLNEIEIDLPEKIAIVVDNSASVKGWDLVFIETVTRLFAENTKEGEIFFVGERCDWTEARNPLKAPFSASGASDFMLPIAKAIGAGYRHIYCLTDGRENRGNGAVDELLHLKAVQESGCQFYQVSPHPADPLISERMNRLQVLGLEEHPLKERLQSFHLNIQFLITYLEVIKKEVLEGRPLDAIAQANFHWIPVKVTVPTQV